MSKKSTPRKAVPKKSERKQEASGTHEQFSVAQFTERVVFLDAEDIRIDRDLTRGQVRSISESNVADLETAYSVNEPDELQLTVSQDRGNCTLLCPGSSLAPLALDRVPVPGVGRKEQQLPCWCSALSHLRVRVCPWLSKGDG